MPCLISSSFVKWYSENKIQVICMLSEVWQNLYTEKRTFNEIHLDRPICKEFLKKLNDTGNIEARRRLLTVTSFSISFQTNQSMHI